MNEVFESDCAIGVLDGLQSYSQLSDTILLDTSLYRKQLNIMALHSVTVALLYVTLILGFILMDLISNLS